MTTTNSLYNFHRDGFYEILDPRTHTIEWLDAQVNSGGIQVWGDQAACILTQNKHFPTGAFEVHVMAAIGSKTQLISVTIKQVERWAKDIGALFVTIASRKGWEREMRPYDYEFWQSELRKEV